MSEQVMPEDAFVEENVESPITEAIEGSEAEEIAVETSEEVTAETQEELKEEIADAIENGASEQEVQNMVKSFQLKVNGKTIEKEIDLSDEDALKRELQMAAAGRDSMQKARELEKAYEQALIDLKSDPLKFLQSELELDVDELSYNHLKALHEQSQKSPEEVEREKIQLELEQAREEARILKEEKERAEYEKIYEKEQQALNSEIESALEVHKDLPSTQKTFQRIAETMLFAMENGIEEVTVEDVIPQVKKDIEREMNEMFSEMPAEFYEKFIGKQNMEKMRQSRIAKAKSAPNPTKVKETAVPSQKKEKKERVRAKDYFKNLGLD